MIDKRLLRDALGSFATGICVVTAVPEQGAPIGMTINSFSSVSLEPPLVLWSIQNVSECFGVFGMAERFAINVLSKEQEALSQRYATKADHALLDEHHQAGRDGLPLIRGALTSFECRVWARYPGGDHLIIVGEVMDVRAQPSGRPLLFHQGRYAALA